MEDHKQPTPYYPIMVRLEGRPCVVVGGGNVGWRKIAGLLRCGAAVTVVAPEAIEPIRDAAAEGRLAWKRRTFLPEDAAGASFVFAATSDAETNARICEAAARVGALANAAGAAEEGDFIVPSSVRRGRFTIAVTTGGASPTLARRMAGELAKRYGEEYAAYMDILFKLRKRILESPSPAEEKRRRLKALASINIVGQLQGGKSADDAALCAWTALNSEEGGV